MKASERISKAIEEFCKNEFWKEFYENAPSKKCQEYIALSFSRSLFDVEEDFTQKVKIEPDLTKADWEYLLRYAGNNQGVASVRAKMKSYGIEP